MNKEQFYSSFFEELEKLGYAQAIIPIARALLPAIATGVAGAAASSALAPKQAPPTAPTVK